MLLKDCRLNILDAMLDLIWSQWTTLGVSGSAPVTENWILDPEALVLFTCNIGRYEPRIFDSMLEWLSVNQRFLNIQRLKNINKREGFSGGNLLAAIAHLLMKPTSRTKWERLGDNLFKPSDSREPLFYLKDGSPHPHLGKPDGAFEAIGLVRSEFKSRQAIVQFRPDYPANLILKLRALFGLNSRCEIIAYLHLHTEGNPTEIASTAGYSSKTIYNAISEMYQSGTLHRRVKGKETLYSLKTQAWEQLLADGSQSAHWMNWPKAFRALEIIWAALDNPWLENEPAQTGENDLRLALNKVLPELQEIAPRISHHLQPSIELSMMDFKNICLAIHDLVEHCITG